MKEQHELLGAEWDKLRHAQMQLKEREEAKANEVPDPAITELESGKITREWNLLQKQMNNVEEKTRLPDIVIPSLDKVIG